MRKLWIAIGVVVALLAAAVATVMLASEYGGEVVTVTTFDAQGTPHDTRLWIVDLRGIPYLRGGPDSGWVQRLDSFAELDLERGGKTVRYQALPALSDDQMQRVEAAMASEYGLADRLIGLLRGDTPPVAFRLTPLDQVQPQPIAAPETTPSPSAQSLVASVESLVLDGRGARFEALASLPGRGPEGAARAISANGRVVVGESGGEAYRWDGNQLMGLGHLPAPRLVRGVSAALAVSSDGGVVVGRSSSQEGVQAFRWQNGKLEGLGDLPGGSFLSMALGVSGDGSVIVGRGSSEAGIEAFRWSDGEMQGLGDLAGGAFNSVATAVSADGRVIVGVSDSDRGYTAFRWEGGIMSALEGPRGVRRSRATAVSADGSVIVGDCDTEKGRLPFRWTRASNEMELLPELAPIGSDFDSGALAVSSDGSVVAGSSVGAGDAKSGAFVWSQDEGTRGVQKIVVLDHLIEVSDWLFEASTGISGDGSVLVGSAVDDQGVSRSWIFRRQ